jgi:hypothetical protein
MMNNESTYSFLIKPSLDTYMSKQQLILKTLLVINNKVLSNQSIRSYIDINR